jgi:cytochrome bd-type quinol oxidase subunit 2
MAGTTVLFGSSLILLGVLTFGYTWQVHHIMAWTALIPAAIGVVLAGLGAWSFNDSVRKHTMHAAAFLASLTFLVCFVMAAPALHPLVTQGKVLKTNSEGLVRDATLAVISQLITALITLIFVLICVRSFARARLDRARAQAAAKAT